MKQLPIARVADALESASELDGVIEPLAAAVRRAPRSALDLLHGAPLGHPAHPLAVLVPAGAWLSAAVLDLLPGNERAARTLVGAGVLAAAPAAAAGAADWSQLRRRQQRVGVVHAVTNSAAVALYGLSWIARGAGRQRLGKALAVGGLTAVSVGGYLGGHLSYRQSAGANHAIDAYDRFPEGWHTIGLLDEVQPDTAHRWDVDGVSVLLAREGAAVTAAADVCTLCGERLSTEGSWDGILTCPRDGSVFEIGTGEVVHGPATLRQPSFSANVSEGFVRLRLH